MKIDIHNYEAFFLDFVEGRLDDASTLEMLAFLRKHPDLKAELESFTDVRLESSEVTFQGKNELKKFDFQNSQVTLKNFEDYCIAHYEKLLSPRESEKLFKFLALNPDKQDDFKLFGKTVLKADTSVIFEAKPFLKRKPKGAVRTIILKWTAVAAGIVLIVSVFYKSPDKSSTTLPQNIVAVQSEKVEQKSDAPVTQKVNEVKVFKTRARTTVDSQPVQSPVEFAFEKEENLQPLKPLDAAKLRVNNEEEHPETLMALNSTVSAGNYNDEEDFEVLDYAEKVLREKVLKSKNQDPVRRKFSLWDLADITLKGYNRISEKDIILHRKTDEKGKLTVLAIETENRKYGFESKN